MRAIGRALRTFKEVLSKNKMLRLGLVYGLAGVVAMAVVMTGIRGLAASRQPTSTAAATTVQQSSDESRTSDGKEKEQEVSRNYSGADTDVVEALMTYSWTDGEAVVTFGPSEARISKKGEQERSAEYTVSQTRDDGERTETFTDAVTVTSTVRSRAFVVEYGGTAYPATIETTQRSDASKQIVRLTCAAFSDNALEATSASNELQVKDVGQLLQYIGGSATPLEEALRSWASSNSPAATEAKWDGIVTIDSSGNTATFSMTLSAAMQSKVSVTYKATDGTFKISYTK